LTRTLFKTGTGTSTEVFIAIAAAVAVADVVSVEAGVLVSVAIALDVFLDTVSSAAVSNCFVRGSSAGADAISY
jgi:hypothetical protein